MLDREPFLRAIFAAPDDDLPRLVFADYLEEQGDAAWAELIRVQCELARLPEDDPRWPELTLRDRAAQRQIFNQQRAELGDEVLCALFSPARMDRGFHPRTWISVEAEQLGDPDAFRLFAVSHYPEWYGATELKVTSGRITTPDQLQTLLAGPVTERVTKLDLSGNVVETPVRFDGLDEPGLSVFDVEVKPVVTVRMVEALAGMRECRRLTDLDLRNDELDNDAARALTASPHLYRLCRLALLEGNRFKGRMWQQVLARFGPDVAQ
jgi:uncharacterized protein (TIGR02996 family)